MIFRRKICWILQSDLGIISHLPRDKMAFHTIYNILLSSTYQEGAKHMTRIIKVSGDLVTEGQRPEIG